MKKLWKKLLAVTTAVMMAITLLPTMANAKGTTIDYTRKGNLTIVKTTGKDKDGKTTTLQGAQFTIYKIASLEENGYKMLVTAGDYKTPESLLNLSSEEQMSAAAAFKNNVTEEYRQDSTDANGKIEFKDLDLGYYLVVETQTPASGKYVTSAPFFVAIPTSNTATGPVDEMDSSASTTSWEYNVTAKPKNEEVSIDKKIVEGDTTKDKDTVAVGDIVNYEITSTSPKYTDEYFTEGGAKKDPTYNIHDTLSAGLTLNKDSIKVFANNSTEELGNADKQYYSVEEKMATDAKGAQYVTGFEIKFTKKFLKDYSGVAVKVTYNATVNENAIVGKEGNTNEVTLDYTNKPGADSTGVPGKTTPTVYTYGLVVNKVDGKEKTALAGATFKLYKVTENEDKKEIETQVTGLKGMNADGTYTTSTDGKVIFNGLDKGKYKLEETKAPNGYTLLKDKIEFTITDEQPDGEIDQNSSKEVIINKDNKGQLATTITNNKGFNLPSTGGMGTYLFTIGGIIVMAGAVILLIASKKKRA